MRVQSRKLMVFGLVGVFAIQTWMVYTDPAGRRTPPLSARAQRGWEVWHDNNCQSCHQLYGFGGFLGPDLTNASARLTPARLEQILTVGAGAMPAFGLEAPDREALRQFLEEVDATGVGELRLAQRRGHAATLAGAVDPGAPLTQLESRGRDVVLAQACLGCHRPNPAATLGAPDLRAAAALTPGALNEVLERGRPSRGMPAFGLVGEERSALVAYLRWLRENREAVGRAFEASSGGGSSGVPWFEYPRR